MARSVGDAADELGRAGRCEDAHQNRLDALILVVALVGQGENGDIDDCSPEFVEPLGVLRRC